MKKYIVYYWRNEDEKKLDCRQSVEVLAHSESNAIQNVRYSEPITKNSMIVDSVVFYTT